MNRLLAHGLRRPCSYNAIGGLPAYIRPPPPSQLLLHPAIVRNASTINRRNVIFPRPAGMSARSMNTSATIGSIAAALRPSAILNTFEPSTPDTTGYIAMTGENEGLLFFDNVFPLKIAIWDLRYLVTNITRESLEAKLAHYLPQDLPPGFKIESIHPRHKDGGAFLKFSLDNHGTDNVTPKEIAERVSAHLKKIRVRPWFSPLRQQRAYLVEGTPWTEDLNRFPSNKLRIEFQDGPGELSQESLYNLFRKFGKIAEITPQATSDKTTPRYALVQYMSVRSATAARNCLHRARYVEANAAEGVKPVVLRITYERTIKAHWLRDWLVNHPKIVIPVLAAVIATITVAIFDPIRTWFVKAKITGALSIHQNEYFNWLRRHTVGYFPFRKGKPEDSPSTLLEERKGTIESLKSWLLDSNETFIVVQGPRGSGKRELVMDHVLGKRKNVLVIDCEHIVEAHGDSATIAAAAAQVGYRPVFSWMNTFTSLADLAAQGTIGTSAGFSQTLENQFNKILQNTGTALKEVALDSRTDDDAPVSDEEYLSTHPERRPVIVIDNFLHTSEGTMIYDRLADWAALLVSANIAHVIFLTNDVSFSKSLSRALPDRVFRSVLLGDASPESAKQFILNQLGEMIPHNEVHEAGKEGRENLHRSLEQELDASIAVLGGRLTDLESLATRIRSGEGPALAVQQIVEASAAEISKLFLSADQHYDPKSRKWNTEQAWFLITSLTSAKDNTLRYHEILLHDLFKDAGEDSIQGLEHSELISIVNDRGRAYSIKPGRPVYKAAFNKLMEDEVLKARMDMAMLNRLIKVETDSIRKYEDEMALLATVGGGKEVQRRIDYLGRKLGASQLKVEDMEDKVGRLKTVLKQKY